MPDFATDPKTPEKKPARSFAALRPTKLIVEIGAAVLCLLFLVIVGLMVVDQLRHWTSKDYRMAQIERRDFYCAKHFDRERVRADELSQIEQTEYEVQKLLETARMRALPTDSIGKLSTFVLCAKVLKLSISSVEIVETIGEGGVAELEATDSVAELRGRLKTMKAAVKRYPDEIYDSQERLLAALQVSVEKQADPIQVAKLETGQKTGQNNRWLIVAGADQSDDAALGEVKRLETLLADLPQKLQDAALPPQIYRIRSWWRTVVPFASQEAAEVALKALSPKLPYGGYLRAEAQWCPDATLGIAVGSTIVTKCGP